MGVAARLLPSQLAVLIPAAAAVVILGAGRHRRVAGALASVAALVALLATGWMAARLAAGTAPTRPGTIGALPTGGAFDIPMRLQLTALTVTAAVAVALVALVVQLFARWYLRNDSRYHTFAATVSLFTAAMQLVVLSGDVLLTIVGWEVMGWCSYLLIGHDSDRQAARRAAHKAFLVTRFADAPFFIGLIALAIGAGSTDIPTIVGHWGGHPGAAATAALICVTCGVAGKSAQVPFQDWLADAMEGPSPASALIHAATMVAAGTLVLATLMPLIEASTVERWVLVLVAGISTVLAALVAFGQRDLKRLLAWSTVSQVGIMLLALAILPVGASPDLAVLQLISHAMFKSLLFLALGWLAVLVAGNVVPRMSGALRRHPSVDVLLAIGLLTLAGVPPFFGFVSKELVVDGAARGLVAGDPVARVGFAALVIVVALTAAYCMRAWLILDHRTGAERRKVREVVRDSHRVREVGIVELFETSAPVDARGHELYHPPPPEPEVEEAPEELAGRGPRPQWSARFGLGTLALLCIIGGGLIFTPVMNVPWRHPNILMILAALMLMAAAAVLVRTMSLHTVYGDAAERLPAGWRRAAVRGLGADTAYLRLVARPCLALARVVARIDDLLDRGVLELVTGAASLALHGLAAHRRRPTDGLLALAGGLIVVGVLGVMLW